MKTGFWIFVVVFFAFPGWGQEIVGFDVGVHMNKSLAQLESAAGNGDTKAAYELGYAYAGTKEIPRDFAKAVVWTRKAAEKGHAGAQYNLGVFYYHGYGVPKSHAEAIKWWRKAAENGEPRAQYNLGYQYIVNSEDVSKDDVVEALKWWFKAAKNGEPGAQFYLGVFYHDGNGVPRDYEESYKRESIA